MHPRQILMPPEAARNAIEREEDLFRFPGLVFEQLLKIPARLVKIEYESVMDNHCIDCSGIAMSQSIAEAREGTQQERNALQLAPF